MVSPFTHYIITITTTTINHHHSFVHPVAKVAIMSLLVVITTVRHPSS